jgi:HTH-type transcriptional regulator/antitoxin HigA
MSAGVIPKTTLLAKNKPGLVDVCLRFFGVASPEEWRNHYGAMEVAYRRSRQDQSDVGAISSWLRLGEQQSEVADGPKYDKVKFEKALQSIRLLTCEPPKVFEPRMRSLLHDAGVSFVMVPSIPGAHVSGVARWLNPTRPLIQLSLYGKTNDKFWFTFFHEAAHILLHANTQADKKSVFLDDPNASHTDDPKETEANSWARDYIIPRQYAARLASLKTKSAVALFAQQVGVHSGIVVGRLQHDGMILPSWMNDLKVSFSLKNGEHA